MNLTLKHGLVVGLVALLGGCEDPADSLMQGFPEEGGAGGPPMEGGAPGPGGAEGDAGGGGGQPPGGLSANGTIIDNNQSVKAGEGVVVSGTLSYGGSKRGSLLIDALRKEEAGIRIMYSFVLFNPGPFKLELPKDVGELRLTAFVDTIGDGPTADDPKGMSRSLDIGTDDIDDVEIVIKDDGDLGEFKPWNTLMDRPPGQPKDGAAPGDPDEDGDGAAAAMQGPPAEPAGGAPPGGALPPGQDPSAPQDGPPPGEEKPVPAPDPAAVPPEPGAPQDGADGGADGAPAGDGSRPPGQAPAGVPAEEGAREDAAAYVGTPEGAATKSRKLGGLFKPNGEPWDPSAD